MTSPQLQPYPILPNLYVTPTTFRMQMEYLSRSCRVLPLQELVTKILTGENIPDKTVAVTFDNGWRDNYDHAFPILRNLKIPATIFLATSFIGTMNLFWTDKIIAAMLLLEKAGVKFPDLPGFDQTLLADGGNSSSTQLAYSMARIFHMIEYLKNAPEEEKTLCFEALGAGVEQIGGIPTDRVFLSWDEVREMANAGISFGSNGHCHIGLRDLKGGDLEMDLRLSQKAFADVGIPCSNIFSLPEGALSKNGREILYNERFPVALALGNFPLAASPPNKQSMILGRTPMFESVAYAKDLFACRLWGISSLGESY